MSRASRRGAALATGGIAGLAIATLVLPQLANTLKPTAVGVALLTLVLGMLTLAAQRFREFYRRRTELDTALLAYPPELLGSADPIALGVVASNSEPHRSAELSTSTSTADRLDRALMDSPCVVVRGPSACGKSKAAADAAARVWPSVAGIVPFNADGLGTLQDEEFHIGADRCDNGICLWLDDLDRFLGVLDTRSLTPRRRKTAVGRRLTRRDPQAPRLIATVRSERWDETRKGTDDQSQTLRRLESVSTLVTLDQAGRVVDIQPEPEPEPEPEPGQDGTPTPPALPSRPASKCPRAKPLWRDALFVVLALATAAVGVAIAILYGVDRKVLVQPPPVSDQIASITTAMQTHLGHGHVVFSERVWLHSTEEPSWIIGVQHGPTQSLKHGIANSDELRIYDVHDGWLELKLDFQPTVTGPSPPHLQQVADNSSAAGLFNNGGIPEFIAGYNLLSRASPTILPFGIDWQTGANGSGYVLRGLTEFSNFNERMGPGFSLPYLRRSEAAFLKANYDEPIMLRNRHVDLSNQDLSAYPVSAFALARQPSGRLLLGYLLRPYDYTRTNDLEFEVGQLRSGGVATHPCSWFNPTCWGPKRPEVIHVPPDKGDSQALLDEWPQLKSHWVHRLTETNL